MHKHRKTHIWSRGMIPHGTAKAEEHFINMGFFDHCPGLKGSGTDWRIYHSNYWVQNQSSNLWYLPRQRKVVTGGKPRQTQGQKQRSKPENQSWSHMNGEGRTAKREAMSCKTRKLRNKLRSEVWARWNNCFQNEECGQQKVKPFSVTPTAQCVGPAWAEGIPLLPGASHLPESSTWIPTELPNDMLKF